MDSLTYLLAYSPSDPFASLLLIQVKTGTDVSAPAPDGPLAPATLESHDDDLPDDLELDLHDKLEKETDTTEKDSLPPSPPPSPAAGAIDDLERTKHSTTRLFQSITLHRMDSICCSTSLQHPTAPSSTLHPPLFDPSPTTLRPFTHHPPPPPSIPPSLPASIAHRRLHPQVFPSSRRHSP